MKTTKDTTEKMYQFLKHFEKQTKQVMNIGVLRNFLNCWGILNSVCFEGAG